MWYGIQQGCSWDASQGPKPCYGSYQYLFHVKQSLRDPLFTKVDIPKFRNADRNAINTLKDTYFSETPEKAVEAQAAEKVNEVTEEEGDPVVEVSSNMEKYLTAIRQNSN